MCDAPSRECENQLCCNAGAARSRCGSPREAPHGVDAVETTSSSSPRPRRWAATARSDALAAPLVARDAGRDAARGRERYPRRSRVIRAHGPRVPEADQALRGRRLPLTDGDSLLPMRGVRDVTSRIHTNRFDLSGPGSAPERGASPTACPRPFPPATRATMHAQRGRLCVAPRAASGPVCTLDSRDGEGPLRDGHGEFSPEPRWTKLQAARTP